MQRVTSMLPTLSWDKTKTVSKKGFDKTWAWADKLGAPVNRLSNKIGSEAFWPTTLDLESDKAARILKSFCKDGFYAEEDRPTTEGVPKGKQRVLKKIPASVIQNAVGLAIFTTMRTGLWFSGAGGSGILIARKEDGEWSPPSGILLHTAGLGFLVGVDIYDCVVVINNRKALDAFTKIRATLGGEISAVAGPVGLGGVVENDGKWKQANRPVFTYLKSRGFYAGVQVDGTIIIERTDENEKFYGERIGVADILAGKARHPPPEIKLLMETVKSAEGRTDVDRKLLEEIEGQPAPGDVELESPGGSSVPTFGIPEPDDPDPYGVLALEKEGLEIREAGTKSRPPSTQFEYNPSPTSPIYGRFHRRSMDTLATRSNRESYMSTWSSRGRTSTDRAIQTAEMGTQTMEFDTPSTSPSQSDQDKRIVEEDERHITVEPEDIDYTKVDMGPIRHLTQTQTDDLDGTTVNDSPRDHSDSDQRPESRDTKFSSEGEEDDEGDDEGEEEEEEEEEAVIFEAASAQATVLTPQTLKARGGLVLIPKRPPPPPLPPRNELRKSRSPVKMVDQASGQTPTTPSRDGFETVDLHGANRKSTEVARTILKEDETQMPKNNTFEDQLSEALKEHHLGHLTPTITTTAPEEAVKFEGEETKSVSSPNDEDTFHSVSSTPMEQATEVKAI